MKISYADSANGTKYSLTCVNNSNELWTFFVYQRLPNQPEQMFSLVWFASPYSIAPRDQITFEWQLNYNFMWANTGVLQPGVMFDADEKKDCSPAGTNDTTFSLVSNPPTLSTPVVAQPAGNLIIHEGLNIPNSIFSTGIGMSGHGTFAQQAWPNTQQIYTPTPIYYVAAAPWKMKLRSVLEQTVSMTSKVDFGPNIFSVTKTFTESHLWE
jgi:rhizosphere induced protein